jgi:hypothetical protein
LQELQGGGSLAARDRWSTNPANIRLGVAASKRRYLVLLEVWNQRCRNAGSINLSHKLS